MKRGYVKAFLMIYGCVKKVTCLYSSYDMMSISTLTPQLAFLSIVLRGCIVIHKWMFVNRIKATCTSFLYRDAVVNVNVTELEFDIINFEFLKFGSLKASYELLTVHKLMVWRFFLQLNEDILTHVEILLRAIDKKNMIECESWILNLWKITNLA